MKNLIFNFLIFLLVSITSNAQVSISFKSTFGDSTASEQVYAVHPSGYGYVTAGMTSSTGQVDFLLCKFDSIGELKWARSYGGPLGDFAHSVDTTADGGNIMTGWGKSFGAGDDDIYLVKTDENGLLQWIKSFGGTGIDRGRCVRQTTDGGYVIAGHTNSFGSGVNDIIIIKTNANGDSLWSKTYGGSGNESAWWIEQTSDLGYIVTGNTSIGPGFLNTFLMKLNPLGDTVWTKTFGSSAGITSGFCVKEVSSGGGFVATGFTSAYGAGGNDLFILRTDPTGSELWSKTYGGTEDDDGFGIIEITFDGFGISHGFGISGSTKSFGIGIPNKNVFLLQTDLNGNEIVSYAFGDSLNETGYGVAHGFPENFVAVGKGSLIGSDNENLLINIGRFDLPSCNGNNLGVQSFNINFDEMPAGFLTASSSPMQTNPSIGDSLLNFQDSVSCMSWILEVGLKSKADLKLNVYPNPFENDIHISFEFSEEDFREGILSIRDLTGKKLKEMVFNSEETRIDLGSLKSGIYILNLNALGESRHIKIVKK
jgi:Secretion system C-terminal sorting domain